MVSKIVVKEPDSHQVVLARALVELVVPGTSEREWAALVASRWNVAVATDGSGYIKGLSISGISKHPTAGMLVDVPMFVTGSVVGQRSIARAMFKDLVAKARQMGCGMIRFWTTGADTLSLLEDSSFAKRWDHGLAYPVDPDRPHF